jgi:hypothetical protein
MENFLLIQKQFSNPESIRIVFNKYFYESIGIYRKLGDYDLFLFKKDPNLPDNFVEEEGFFIGAFGTPVYKKLSYKSGLEEILKDEISGTLSQENILGHYYLILWDGKVLKILTDGSGILKTYYDLSGRCFSSSFMIITKVYGSKLTLNKQAISENIITGGISGSETIITEINQFTYATGKLPNGIIVKVPAFASTEKIKTKREAFDYQVAILNDYFLSVKNLANEYGADGGLTGGLDSRLLLSLMLKHFSKYQVHSHFRAQRNLDYEIASEICKTSNIPLVSPEVKQWDQMNHEEKSGIFNSALRYCDGQIREHCYWTEEYSTYQYKNRVMKGMRLGLQGIGGEQYRNGERMVLKSYLFNDWIKYQYIGLFAGTEIFQYPISKLVIENIRRKISDSLEFGRNKTQITLLDLKRIKNEIVIPAYRGIKTCSDNRISFSLSPFADFKVSHASYSIVPFMDCTYNFEIELIKYYSPGLSRIRSTYGYNFSKGESFMKYIIPVLIQNFLPFGISLKILEDYKSLKHKRFRNGDLKNERFLKQCINNIEDVQIPLVLDNFLKRPQVSNMLFGIGYLIGELKDDLR